MAGSHRSPASCERHVTAHLLFLTSWDVGSFGPTEVHLPPEWGAHPAYSQHSQPVLTGSVMVSKPQRPVNRS